MIFVGILPPGTSRSTINNQIKIANSNPRLPYCEKEMLSVEWVNAATSKQIEKKSISISKYALDAIKLFNKIYV